jgi:hypothetical protein
MPNPARIMGVNPTLGLTTEPVKVLMGDCCDQFRQNGEPAADDSYALYANLFEIAAGLVSEHDAEFMDPLWHCTQGQSWPE